MIEGAGSVAVFAPAKLNLFLSVIGKREDGYHDLVSLTSLIRFGDSVWITPESGEIGDSMSCSENGESLDCGPQNLVLVAASEFRRFREIPHGIHFHLEKRIPVGSGLGGGSSDAAAVLRGLNAMVEVPLERDQLFRAAARIGSDVPLFLEPPAAVLGGRGDRVEPLDARAKARVSRRRVLIFKPSFSVSTAWAYSRLDEAERENSMDLRTFSLPNWLDSDDRLERLISNSFSGILRLKFPAYPVLMDRLNEQFGLTCGISGSGSAAFALIPEGFQTAEVEASIRTAWGPRVFMVESRLA